MTFPRDGLISDFKAIPWMPHRVTSAGLKSVEMRSYFQMRRSAFVILCCRMKRLPKLFRRLYRHFLHKQSQIVVAVEANMEGSLGNPT